MTINPRRWLRWTKERSGGRPLKRLIALASVCFALSLMLPAHLALATAGEHVVTGAGCHDLTFFQPTWQFPWWYWYHERDCLIFDASSAGAPYGRAILSTDDADGAFGQIVEVVVALDCFEVESYSWGHQAFSAGTDLNGNRFAITVIANNDGRSGFIAGSATGPAPCGARDHSDPWWMNDNDEFRVVHSSESDDNPPVASFDHTCEGSACTFDATSSFDPDGSIERYRWKVDGNEGVATSPTFTYEFASYTRSMVNLVVVDDGGNASEITKPVEIGHGPTAAFTYRCNGLTCDFDGSSSSDPDGTIAWYLFYFPDQQYGVWEQDPFITHTFPRAGTYFIDLTVRDDSGVQDWVTQAVAVTDEPSPSPSPTPRGRGKKS